MILGLDISTSVTGYAVLDVSGELVELGHVALDKLEGWDKADAISKWARELKARHAITAIFLEQSLMAFRPGLSSAATLSTLTRFNGIVSYIVRDTFGIDPQPISAGTARTKIGVKVKRGKQFPNVKEQVFRHVTTHMLHRDWPVGRTGKIKTYCYDEVDGYVIAEAGRLMNSTKTLV